MQDNHHEHEYDGSPVSQLPRLPGDPVDDERLIARLHAAIAKETGPFVLPWYQTTWAKSLMVTSALLVASVVGLSVGRQLGPASFDSQWAGQDPGLLATFRAQDRAYDTAPNKDEWEAALFTLLDSTGVYVDAAESRTIFAGEPTAPLLLSTDTDYKG